MGSEQRDAVFAVLDDDPKASIKTMIAKTGLTKPTVISHRKAWRVERNVVADDQADEDDRPNEPAAGALQAAFPPANTKPADMPKPTEDETKTAKPPRRYILNLTGRRR